MRSIKFEFKKYDNDRSKNIYGDIKVAYNKKDKCLFTLNGGGNGMLAIENSNVILNLDLETKRICGIDGYIGDLSLKQKVNIPSFSSQESGILYAIANENFLSGIAYEFKFDGNIKYDSDNKILVLGEFDYKNEIYHILNNV